METIKQNRKASLELIRDILVIKHDNDEGIHITPQLSIFIINTINDILEG